ncbi:MAG TPA: hypothetical protein PKY72_03855 [Bacilli bacterium]|nr:hypothetical protein [Bacilli bacterium]
MTFLELNRKMRSMFDGERFEEEDFAKFLKDKGVVCAADLIRQVMYQFTMYQNGNDEIFGTKWEKFPAYLKAFEISGIGKKFAWVQDASGRNERLDINDEDVMDEAQKRFLVDFAKRYDNHTPDSKDELRADTCVTKKDPVRAAKNQLKAICDTDKFYRRLKAFLRHGIQVHDVKDTQFDAMNSTAFEKWLAFCLKIYGTNDTLTVKEAKIQKAAQIFAL